MYTCMYVCVYLSPLHRERNLLHGIGPWDYGGWQVPRPAVESASWRPSRVNMQCQSECEGLRTKRANGMIPVWRLADSRPRNSQRFSLSLNARTSQYSSSKAVKNSLLFRGRSAFLYYSGLQRLGRSPPPLGRTILLYSVYQLNVDLIQKCPHRNTQNVWPNIWAPYGSVKWTEKINHHMLYNMDTPQKHAEWKQADPKGYRLHDSIHMKHPEQTNPWKQRAIMVARDWWGEGNGEQLLNGHGVSIWGDENILEPDSRDGRTALWTYLMLLNYTL